MDISAFIQTDIFRLIVIPLLIFLSRIVDVSIGTIRVIFISKGFKLYAPILGFFEVIIWLLAMNQIIGNLTNIYNYIAYGLGFTIGTYVGMMIEEKLSVGKVAVRVMSKKDASPLIKEFRKEKIAYTVMGSIGHDEKVITQVKTIIDRKKLTKVRNIIHKFNPNAFYSIEDIKYMGNQTIHGGKNAGKFFKGFRKSK
jgi:uncharacterized protein YebE (UPF0316 family)